MIIQRATAATSVILFTCPTSHMHIPSRSNIWSREKTQVTARFFNLGTGNGVSVLEAIQAFEKVSGVKLNYEIGPRRPGDVVAIYANNDKARKVLGWEPRFSLEEMMETAWKWELRLKEDEKLFSSFKTELN